MLNAKFFSLRSPNLAVVVVMGLHQMSHRRAAIFFADHGLKSVSFRQCYTHQGRWFEVLTPLRTKASLHSR
jgi:hypothetical protein